MIMIMAVPKLNYNTIIIFTNQKTQTSDSYTITCTYIYITLCSSLVNTSSLPQIKTFQVYLNSC